MSGCVAGASMIQTKSENISFKFKFRFLAYPSWKLKWAFLIACRLSVRL